MCSSQQKLYCVNVGLTNGPQIAGYKFCHSNVIYEMKLDGKVSHKISQKFSQLLCPMSLKNSRTITIEYLKYLAYSNYLTSTKDLYFY